MIRIIIFVDILNVGAQQNDLKRNRIKKQMTHWCLHTQSCYNLVSNFELYFTYNMATQDTILVSKMAANLAGEPM